MARPRPDGEQRLRDRLNELAAQADSLRYEDFPHGGRGATGFSAEWAQWYPRVSQLIRWAFDEASDAYRAVATADANLDRIFAEPASSFEDVKELYLDAIRTALANLDGD